MKFRDGYTASIYRNDPNVDPPYSQLVAEFRGILSLSVGGANISASEIATHITHRAVFSMDLIEWKKASLKPNEYDKVVITDQNLGLSRSYFLKELVPAKTSMSFLLGEFVE